MPPWVLPVLATIGAVLALSAAGALVFVALYRWSHRDRDR